MVVTTVTERKTKTIRISMEIYNKIIEFAKKENRSIKDTVDSILRDYMELERYREVYDNL